MSVKLYPPYINGTLPAFWLNYDASGSQVVGASIVIPFSDNPAINDSIKGYSLRLRTASTGSYLFEPIYTQQKDTENNTVTFNLTTTQARKLKEGQFYKAQIAYCGSSGESSTGYYSTVGIIKCTSKPKISISNLSLENINFFTGDFIGLYDQTGCKDQTEKVYSYSFQIYDNNGDIYYDTGELLHNASYDTDYSYSIDRVSINEFVAQDVTYSVQYNVTTLNGLQLSTGQYRLTNEGFAALNRNIIIKPESNLENGYITINFKGDIDKDRSFCYVLDEEQLANEKDNNGNYLSDSGGSTVLLRIRDSLTGTSERLSFMKNNNIYRYYSKGLDFPYRYSIRDREMTNYIPIQINNKTYYYQEGTEIQTDPTYYYVESYDDELHPIISTKTHTIAWINQNRKDIYFNQNHEMIQGEDIISTPLYQLVATGRDLIRSLTYNYIEENGFFVNENGKLQSNEGVVYQLIDKEEYEAFYYGAFLLSRASDADNYSTWEKINRFRLEEQPPSSYSVKDFTIEHGRKYIYSLQQYNLWGLYSTRVISDVYQAGFEDAFLYDGKRALKIRFNPEVSNFKTTILEQKTDTLGGRFPYITRNGETYYKEFPIGGLIAAEMDEEELFINRGLVTSHRHSTSAIEADEPENGLRDYHMFSDENIMLERQFKLEVLNWLNDGKPKLFKSPYEGNYIVRLMNTSLTPVKELGRMLHSFQTTAYEIAECNYDNLVRFGFINTSEPSDTIGLWNSINLADYPAGQDIYLNFSDGELVSFSVQDMMPGDIIEILYASGEPVSEKIMIGITGAYICAGIDRKISGVRIPARHLIPDIGDKNEQKMTGIINCYYQGARITAFDAIAGMQLKTIPSYQFIGVDPKLENMKLVDWSDKTNSGAFVRALTTGQFKTFQGYELRDYLDQMIEKTDTINGQTQYFISEKGQKYIAGFDPGDLVSRINATLNSGEADKIKMIKLEQGHFRLRELVPVYVQNSEATMTGSQLDTWMVSVSPFGYPHPIEELIEFEMIDPFCVFEVYKMKNGYWTPVEGPYNKSPYYDPHYKDWLYDYEPYIKMNYQAKKISYIDQNSVDKPYKRNDLIFTTNSETGEISYTYNGFIIPESRIYDIDIKFDETQETYKYYYEDELNYDNIVDQTTGIITKVPKRIYLTPYNYFDSLEPQPLAAYSNTPISNAIYYIKQYDSIIDLSIVKEKNYKDFTNINSIHLGTGVMAEMTFQIKVIDYYTEINQANTEVIEARNAYLEKAAFYRTIMQTYATIAHADAKKTKYTALERLYERLLQGKNQVNLKDLNTEDIQIINTLLGHPADKFDLKLLDIYEAIVLKSDTLGTDLLEYLVDLFKNNSILKTKIYNMTNINDIMNFLDNIIIYTTAYGNYLMVNLKDDDIEIVNKKEDEKITLTNLPNYDYYQYINLDSNIIKYYFIRKDDENIQELLSNNMNLIKDKIAYKPINDGYEIVEDITNLHGETILKLSKADYDKFYNDKMVALNKDEYNIYKNNKECLWIQLFDRNKTQLYEDQEIENILTQGTTSEGAQSKLNIIKAEIEEFTNKIDEIQANISNSDIEYKTVYENLKNAIIAYNQGTYFYWGLQQLSRLIKLLHQKEIILTDLGAYLNNAELELTTNETLAITFANQIKTTVDDIMYNASEDFQNIKLYERIINDKDNDSSLDTYHRDQIKVSCGKILKIAYELYFSGLSIVFILYNFKDDISEEVFNDLVNVYKSIGQSFKSTFNLCLIDDNLNNDYIHGLKEYYNNLLNETNYLLTTMKNNWESTNEINLDIYKDYYLKKNELNFINYILCEPIGVKYNSGVHDKLTDNELLTPLMKSTVLQYFIDRTELNNTISPYISKNYSLKDTNIELLDTILIETWMEEENSEGKTYLQLITDRFDFMHSLQQEEIYTPYKKYIQKTGIGSRAKNSFDGAAAFESFIYNPLMSDIYAPAVTRYSFVPGKTYYTTTDNEHYQQAIGITNFDPTIEYYFLADNATSYICVNNLKTHEYMNIPRNYEMPNGYMRITGTIFPEFYYYDTVTNNYIPISATEPFYYDTTYYIRKKIYNLEYFNTLTLEEKATVLDISLNANHELSQMTEYLQTKVDLTNGKIQDAIQSILKNSIDNSVNLFKDYPAPNIESLQEQLNAALNAYNNLIMDYQYKLQEAYTDEEYLDKINEFGYIDPNELHTLRLDRTLNYLWDISNEDLTYSDLWNIFIRQDKYKYFYCHDHAYEAYEPENDPKAGIIIDELEIIKNKSIYFIPKSIKFFTEIKDGELDDTGIAYWYKNSLEQLELKKYMELLEEAIELQELYEQQYNNYLNKYEYYASEAEEGNNIYNSYFDESGQPTREMEYYQQNNSNSLEQLREEVRELWWAFLNILDDTYTKEKARGMYV